MTGFGLARRVLALFAGAVFTAAIALVLGTVVPRPFWPHEVIASGEQHRVLMLMNPIHTDLAISLEPAVRSAFSFAGAAGQPIDAAGARYLVIGWGGRDFYTQTPTWSQVKLLPLLKGLTFRPGRIACRCRGRHSRTSSRGHCHRPRRRGLWRSADADRCELCTGRLGSGSPSWRQLWRAWCVLRGERRIYGGSRLQHVDGVGAAGRRHPHGLVESPCQSLGLSIRSFNDLPWPSLRDRGETGAGYQFLECVCRNTEAGPACLQRPARWCGRRCRRATRRRRALAGT